MDDFSPIETIKSHKGIAIAVSIVLVLFVAFSVVRYNQVHSATDAQSQQEASQSDPDAEAIAELSDKQRSEQDDYTQDKLNVVYILQSSLWATEDKDKLISFSDRTYTERTAEGASNTKGYVIVAVEESDTTGVTDDVQFAKMYNIAFEDKDDTYFMSLEKDSYQDGNIQYYLKSSAFASANNYSPISASGVIKVDGINQDLLQLIDNKGSDLETTVKDYCSKYYPSVTTITWPKYVQIDWETNTVTIPFDLNESGSRQVLIEYDRSNKTFTPLDAKESAKKNMN